MSFSYLTIKQITDGLERKEFSCADIVEYYLNRIEANKDLNAFITLLPERALLEAKKVDQKIQSGQRLKKFEGVPISVKDIILTRGVKATGGSRILENYYAPYDASVVKFLKEEGVIILGKTNCDEFAMGASNENSAFGPVKNPWDKSRVPGGSSGGSAASVAADLCAFSVGTDTGGSIRQPAAFCGVTGLKPTYARVSRHGLMAMTSSLDQAGPFTRTAEEAAQILEVIARPDHYDATLSPRVAEPYSQRLNEPVKNLTIGLPKEYFGNGLDQEIESAIQAAVKEFKKLGVKIKKVSLPHTAYSLAVYYVILPAEVSSNLARYDGIRYGSPSKAAKNLEEFYSLTRARGFGAEVKRRVMIGTFVLSAGYQDAYYKQALRVQKIIQQEYRQVFKQVDALITPTTPTPPFKLGEKLNDPLTMYLADIYTVSANIAGLCGLNIPCGLTKDKLPVGLQLLGAPFHESTILKLGHHFQQATNWHQRRPPV